MCWDLGPAAGPGYWQVLAQGRDGAGDHEPSVRALGRFNFQC